jgi:mono/diheme cytochrome c family protein
MTTKIIALALVLTGGTAASTKETPKDTSKNAKVARGAYLVKGVGCNDCHTPLKLGPNGPEPDMTRMLSGHPEAMAMPPAPKLPPGPWMATAAATMTAWSGPWGTSFTANLTPDRETGLGTWTAKTFVETIRNGRHMGRGRQLLPPMPFPAFANFSDEDLEAMFAYLQSIPAIKNRVPQPLPPPAAVAAVKP